MNFYFWLKIISAKFLFALSVVLFYRKFLKFYELYPWKSLINPLKTYFCDKFWVLLSSQPEIILYLFYHFFILNIFFYIFIVYICYFHFLFHNPYIINVYFFLNNQDEKLHFFFLPSSFFILSGGLPTIFFTKRWKLKLSLEFSFFV